MFGLGMTELLVILAIVLLVFGPKRLKSIGSDLGSAIKGFRSAVTEEDKAEDKDKKLDPNDDGFFNKNEEKQPKMSKEEKERRAKIQEAEALLRKMSDTEKEVREHIRERQAEMLRQEMRRQGIHIPPEANK